MTRPRPLPPLFSDLDVDQAARATGPVPPLVFSHRAPADAAPRATIRAPRPRFQAPPQLVDDLDVA